MLPELLGEREGVFGEVEDMQLGTWPIAVLARADGELDEAYIWRRCAGLGGAVEHEFAALLSDAAGGAEEGGFAGDAELLFADLGKLKKQGGVGIQ